jgi:hypothetical protein
MENTITDYKQEAEKIIQELFFEKHLSINENKENIEIIMRITGISIETMAEQLEQGVINGHSIEKQKEIITKIFKPNICHKEL